MAEARVVHHFDLIQDGKPLTESPQHLQEVGVMQWKGAELANIKLMYRRTADVLHGVRQRDILGDGV